MTLTYLKNNLLSCRMYFNRSLLKNFTRKSNVTLTLTYNLSPHHWQYHQPPISMCGTLTPNPRAPPSSVSVAFGITMICGHREPLVWTCSSTSVLFALEILCFLPLPNLANSHPSKLWLNPETAALGTSFIAEAQNQAPAT